LRLSKLFGKTLRDDPQEAELACHRLMLRAGFIHQVSSGIFSYLPLAWRSLRKIEQIIREEMDAAGGQELRMTVLQPRELWQESGRDEDYGDGMFRLHDRREREMVLAPTHEELLTIMVKANVNSYRDLPLILYQIQTKFRDEPRPRGGLLRVREFDMKDAYSFDTSQEELDASYNAMEQAYKNIYARCGLDAIMVEADSGTIGGRDSQEFILVADSGEDTVMICEGCSYAANAEKAVFVKPPLEQEEPKPLESVHTPGLRTIDDLAQFLDVHPNRTLKAVFYVAHGEVVFVTIRGDLEVNEVKLRNALDGAPDLRLATPAEVRDAGLIAGSASPVGLSGIKVVADDSVKLGANFAVGANREDYHLLNANYGRDFEADILTDIALAEEGSECGECDAVFRSARGIEVGHIFKLGTKYSEVLGATFPDENGVQKPIVMGCYGIGVGRLLAAAIEQNHDEAGMVLPASIAPFEVLLTALNVRNVEVADEAASLYDELRAAGLDVLYDDREESAGVKFNDADLLGLPVRVVVSPRNLKNGQVEVKPRSGAEARMVARGEAVASVREVLAG
jgi:prolyl-tRNA synthetase